MELIKDFLLKEVFIKMQYDKLTERFQILPEAYLSLKLNDKQLKVLEQMCKDNDIDLIKFPKKLSTEETKELFKKYHKLKKELKDKPSKELEEKMYKIRNEIVVGHLEYAYKIILKYFSNIKNRKDKEDIYQSGYEVLIYLVDAFDLEKTEDFVKYLNKYLIPHIARKIYLLSVGISIDDNNKIYNIKKERERFFLINNRMPTILELANITGYPEEKIERLLILEKRIDTDSLDEKLEQLDEENGIETILTNKTSVEETVCNNINGEIIRKIIDTLPFNQSICILLYYGFIDNRPYTYDEIGKQLNITSEAVRQTISSGLDNLKHPVRENILNNIDNELNDDEISNYKKNNSVRDTYLIHFLIKQMPKDLLEKLIIDLKKKRREILMLYFGLEDGIEYTRIEISEKLGISKATVNERLKNGIDEMLVLIKEMYMKKYSGTNKEYYSPVENMMLDYVNRRKHKR